MQAAISPVRRDYDVIMALTLIISIAFILANLAIDIAYTLIDPRIRLAD